MKNKKVVFERPPAAPIFRPTLKEFQDPLDYIQKIRATAQPYGICKIITPKQWTPPFAVDRKSFKFRPRVQRLNEVGAHARIKNNFFRCLEIFCNYQNLNYDPPVLKNQKLDVFELHKAVRSRGGSIQVSKKKQWTQVCRDLGYGDKAKQLCSIVRQFFDQIIQPYLDFCDNMYKEDNAKLFSIQSKSNKDKTGVVLDSPKLTRSKVRTTKKISILDMCNICKTDDSGKMISCPECELKYHIDCLEDNENVKCANWVCKRCRQINCQQELAQLDAEVFGFAQSACKYSLDSFASYADNFKKTYFENRKNVSLKEVEEEYWRLIAAEDSADDVVVKYGADISSSLTSSGFPTRKSRHLYSEKEQQYIDSGWNLNNLPCLNKSIFQFVPNDISGMTVPWCYVGMVFSCFCWHIEDHWSYSINYMHTGDCKTWYGIPESDADKFEILMQQEAKQLFDRSPDLLHHITTQMNPTFLLKNDIKVYRTDQAPGEFVVTFPRAYHAGFNQGFNFAEAVNFCPADWLAKGRASVASYRTVKRPSVFSHSELICKMAGKIESLDLGLLRALLDELISIQQDEKSTRRQLCNEVNTGPCRTERLRESSSVTDDDIERECLVCRTTLYISGAVCVKCFTNTDRMTCLDHIREICTCDSLDNVVLKYRYSLDEITSLVNSVRNRVQQFQLWMSRLYNLARCKFCSSTVTNQESRVMQNVASYIETLDILKPEDLLDNSNNSVEEKPNLEELKMLLQLGKSMNCPTYLLDFLEDIIDTCQRAMSMTDELLKSSNNDIKMENTSDDDGGAGDISKSHDNDDETEHTGQEDENVEESENNKENTEIRTLRNNKKIIKQEAKLGHHSKGNTKHKISQPDPPHIEKAEKLTLPEMRLLVEKLRSLPAHVPQLEQAAQILSAINDWRCQLYSALSSPLSLLDYDSLYKFLHDQSNNNIVYLPENHMIHRMLKYVGWISEAKKLILESNQETNLPTLDKFRKALEQGHDILSVIEIDKIATMTEAIDLTEESDDNNESVDDCRTVAWNTITDTMMLYENQLDKIISDGESIQLKAEEILNSTPGKFALFSLNSLLKSANAELRCRVSGIEKLEKVVLEAELINAEIQQTWHRIQQARRLVHIDELISLLTRADSLCVKFERVNELRSLANTVESWRNRLKSLFIQTPPVPQLPTPTLLEILLPRPARQFRLMIARETALSSRLLAACRVDDFETNNKPNDDFNNSQLPNSSTLNTRSTSNRKSSNSNTGVSGRQKRCSSSSINNDDPLSVRMDNLRVFENYIKSCLSSGSGELGCSNCNVTNNSILAGSNILSSTNSLNINTGGSADLDFYNNYRTMCVTELEWMWNLRQMNEEKASKDSTGRDFYCVCRKRGTDQRGAQVMCDLCQDWLHLACLGLEPHRDLRRRKFLCPQCERSKRPPFELVGAEKRNLDSEARLLLVPEHMALCLMCQRVINFHKHTNQLFSPHTELGAAFNEYKRLFGVQAMLPRCHDQQTMHDSSSITLTGLSNTVNISSNIGHSEMISSSSSSKQSRKTPHGSSSKNVTSVVGPLSTNTVSVTGSTPSGVTNLTGNLLNANPSGAGNSGGLPSKEAKVGIAKLRSSLSDEARRELEEIYIELCLLEVNQPTVTWIWKLYHSLIVEEEEDEEDDDEDNDDDNEDDDDEEGEDDHDDRHNLDRRHRMTSSDEEVDEKKKRRDYMRQLLSGQTSKQRIHQTRAEASNKMEKFSFKRKLAINPSVASRLLPSQSTTSAGGNKKQNPRHNSKTNQKSTGSMLNKKKSKAVTSSRGYFGHQQSVTKSHKHSYRGGEANLDDDDADADYEDFNEEAGYGCDDDDDEDVILLDKAMRKRKLPTNASSGEIAKKTKTTARSNIGSKHNKSKVYVRNEESDDEYISNSPVTQAVSKRGRRPSSNTATTSHGSGSASKRQRKHTGGGGASSNSNAGSTAGLSHNVKKRATNEECAASVCIPNSGEKVDWVACDKCDLWFHWFCVGIRNEKELEKRFLCPQCQNVKNPKRSKPKYKASLTQISGSNTHHYHHHQKQQRKQYSDRSLENQLVDNDDEDEEEDGNTNDDETRLTDPDDLNVAMDEDEELENEEDCKPQKKLYGKLTAPITSSNNNQTINTIPSHISTGIVRTKSSNNNENIYQTIQHNLSPPPPFLQPECCVHEEEVEISYASKSDSDV